MPRKNRVSPDTALLFLADVAERLSLVSLSSAEYAKALNRATAAGTIGGGIYDVLITQCALKVNASALYTWNGKHFIRQRPDVSTIVRRP
ncbi:hypothetical protein [Gemmatimonas sp.]|uniref:hypothetical protein n=1 Tax=Gemmatimonas sp. TaxID=1962908 RepID=UPI0035614563